MLSASQASRILLTSFRTSENSEKHSIVLSTDTGIHMQISNADIFSSSESKSSETTPRHKLISYPCKQYTIVIITGFLINMQVQVQHSQQWASFQVADLLQA